MTECKSYKCYYLLALCLYCITPVVVDTAAAQSPGLSRITPQQITKLMQLPQEFAAYDVVAECGNPNSVRCDEAHRKLAEAKPVFTVAEDGDVKTHQCSQARLFLFGQNQDVWLFISRCQDGPFAMPALLDTKAAHTRFSQRVLDELTRLNPGANPFSELASERTVKLDGQQTIHIFSLIILGHGIGFIPTGVVASSRRNETFVVQFLVVPEGRDIKRPPHPEGRLISRPNQIVEALAKELYRTTR